MKVGDVVCWTLPAYLNEGLGPLPPTMGIIVEMRIGNGANVAWFEDDMRITWVPLSELEVVSES